MAISKDKKRAIIAKLTDALKEASSVVFVGFSKLTVKDASKMRKDLAEAGVRYFVAKKTLLRRALMEHGYEGQVPELPGEVAIAWIPTHEVVGTPTASVGADVTAPARGVHEYSKKLKGAVALLGGVFEGVFADAQKMISIATIPPLPVLRGMFVNVINSPIQGLVVALDQISKIKK